MSSTKTTVPPCSIVERSHRLPNPFIVIRFVVFALLVFLNFQILVFSAWNINAALSASYPVPGVTVFFIFNCCLLYFFLMIAMTEYVRPHTKTGQIKYELCWSGILSLLYLGATIALTVDGPTARCHISKDSSTCASAALLIPVVWGTTLTLLTYFFGFVILVAVHLPVHPEILHNTVYKFPWFCHPEDLDGFQVRTHGPDVEQGLAKVDVTSWTRRTKTLDPPSWATVLKVKRGKDNPFASAGKHQASPSVSDSSITVAPSVPSKDYEAKSAKSPVTPSHYESPFPVTVDNQDVPIPLPRLSSWIRADARNGTSVHTIPIPTP